MATIDIWVAISGSRVVNATIEDDVRAAVTDILARGQGIVVGGAPGVDYIATDQALRLDPTAARLQIVIPASLSVYRQQYELRVARGKATREAMAALFEQLDRVNKTRPEAITELFHTSLTPRAFHDRNSAILEQSSRLVAFQVNNSPGTGNTVTSAKRLGLEVTLRQYDIAA